MAKAPTGKRRWTLRETAIAVAAVFLAVPIGSGFYQQAGYDDAGREKAAEYASYADQEIAEACRGVASIELAHCFSDARIKAELKKRDYEHEQADLVAQRTAALWTNIMGLAAVIGMGLSVVGVYLVWTTFRETQKSNQITMADQRPSVHPDGVNFSVNGNTIRVEIPIKNFGPSDAENIAFTSAISFGPYPLPQYPPPFGAGYAAPSGKMAPGATRWQYLERPDLQDWIETINSEDTALIISAHVSYGDQFGNSYADRFDFFCTGTDFAGRHLRACQKWEADAPEQSDAMTRQGTLDLN